MRMGFGITSSFCTIDTVLEQMKRAIELGYDVIPIVSPAIVHDDTRFGNGEEIRKKIIEITGHDVVDNMVEAEKFGPTIPLDVLVVAPATGNFIGKLANGIIDTPVCMVAKCTLRNQRPVVIGISTNDGLGLNFKNVGILYNAKNIYFIPFGQDDYEKKPNSLVADYELLIPTVEAAIGGKQYQPVLERGKAKQKTL